MDAIISLQNAYTMDNNGQTVQRIVDSAPFAYDKDRNAKRIITTKSIIQKDSSYSTGAGIEAGAKARIIVQPPVGELWRLKQIFINTPTASSTGQSGVSGTHSIRIRTIDKNNLDDMDYDWLLARSKPVDKITISRNIITTGTDLQIPDSPQLQYSIIQDIAITNNIVLVIAYYNETNVKTVGGDIKVKTTFEVEMV